jgi:hypothetical protein
MIVFELIQRYRCGRREIDPSKRTEFGAVEFSNVWRNAAL